MPHPSNNSSSPFTPTDDQQLSTPPNSVEENNAVAVNAKDWFYGTEELLDALPRLWTRSLLYLLIGFSAIALPWAMLSQVDETGTARGRIEPLGATQRLDSQVTASITAVRVKEGEQVRAGQLLVELQSDVLQTDFKQAQAKLEGLINRHSQLELIKNQLLLAIQVQQQQNQSQGKIETFELEISLNQAHIQSGNKHIPLTPGQTATAEVIVRQRRVIDFILDPFKKLQKGGLEL